ncbi:MAG: translocation/assembly module TamB domain-containing protein [Deltaproteobacteria bacterium]|nr:translocation/assembly module TamB domain-containing protein [Deltaproteobacteria bacterium]
MKYFKWGSMGIGSLIAVVLLAVFGGQFYLNTEQARQRILAKVNRAIPGMLTWRQNKIFILGGKVELNHVRLTGPENDKLIELERFSIHVSWTGFLKGELTVDDLFLENPNVSLVKDRSGNLNLIQALYTPGDKPSEPGKNGGLPFNIVLRQLRVMNGVVRYGTAEETAGNQTDHVLFQGVNLTIKDGNLFEQSGRLACQIEKGRIQGKGVRIAIGQIRLNCRLKEKILNIDDVYLHTPLGRFNIRGDVDFKKAFSRGLLTSHPDLNAIFYKFSIRQKNFKLADLPLEKSGFKGVANAEIELEGKGVYPNTLRAETALELYIDKLSAGEGRSPLNVHVSARAVMEKGRVTIGNLTAGAGGSRFEMNGDYDVFSHEVAAHFNLETPDLTEVMTSLGINGVQGRMNMSGDVSGSVRKPSVAARLSGENLGFENIRFGRADVNIRLSNGRLSLEHGKILNGNSGLDFSGSARIFDPIHFKRVKKPDFDVALKGDALFLEDFVQGLKGRFVLTGRVNGSYDQPKGELNLSGKNVDLNIQKFDEIKLSSTIDGRQIHIDPLSLVIAPGEKIVLNGWVSMDKHYGLNLASSDISIINIQKMASLKMDRGKISFDLAGKGEFSNPQFKGKAVIDDLTFNNKKLGKIPFNIGVENQTAYIDGGLNFDLKATYELQTRSFSASARFDNTDLTPYLQPFGKKELKGAITGSIESKGNFGTPIRIEGTTRISQLAIFWKDTPLIKGNDLNLLIRNDEISIPGMRLSLIDHGYFTIKGFGKLNKDFNLKADGTIPFEILPMFTDAFSSATGETRFSLKVNGSLSKPNLIIHANIKDGGMTIPGLFQKLHDMNGSVRVISNAIVTDGIKGMLDTGKFEFSGVIDLDRYQPSNIGLKLKVDDLPISIPDLLDVRLSSELDVRGSPEKSLIKGDVVLLDGTYDKDFRLNLIQSIGQESRQEPLVASKTLWPIFNNMALDCRIGYKDPFVVDNNIALLTIKPDLDIHGTVNRPLISGRAEVESGTVYFQRNEFEVKKGVFDFINPYKIEPAIDIQSDVKIRKWTVSLKISGTPDALRFDMTSDPSETAEDILSLLISGKTTRELIAREGGSSLSPGQMLADVLAESVQKEIKDATGLDVVALEYNEAKDAEASDEVKITVGKELSRRVTVKYGVQTKNAKVIQKVITEYKFLEKVLINTFQDTEGHYGGGIQFRLEFR